MLEKLLQNHQVKRLVEWLRTTMLFRESVSLYDILANIRKNNHRYDIDQRASAVAYSLTLACFPAIIFLFTLVPYIPIDNLDGQILSVLRELMPRGIYQDAKNTITDIISRPRNSVLSLGFIFALVASTNGMLSLMRSFDMVYEDEETRGFLETRGVATLLTIVLVAVMFLLIVLLIVGDAVKGIVTEWHIINDNWIVSSLSFTRYLVSFGALMLAISIIYRFAPSKGGRYAFVNTGSIISSVLILLSTYGFSFYLSRFTSYNKLYGSIGTMIALMIWFYLLAFLLILGFEVNAGIASAGKKVTPERS
ncbi:YihY/virulence factor BrkB family protein [Dyadobacter sp. LHD-138]|uniref:YihY/virulence factor BrkB family protein n=1 Tax=Dyadobacter sp. LHD-138 TaxID=3071413 RepID=UPI0027DFABDB|nr:YihY/virulence factor BrkB family protein [Dyadobacter sp. LHD-138]MDQ6482208.1 YihY/virulence factor BrkB family protein [Dyadobacter sp. LHD-138]